ncbi:serine hydrolase [Candidatus Daviesbacteria bacterium]|nr:serine hydrolase [Candidatus Daviesbacteria bacterium]
MNTQILKEIRKWNYILGGILVVLVVLNIKLFFDFNSKASATGDTLVKKYPYLASRVLTSFDRDLLVNFIPLRKQLREATKDYQETFALYFEYLPTGISIGINDRTEFYGASLIKVPIAMAFLNFARRANLNIDQTVKISKMEINQDFGNLWKRGEGAEISLREALKLALTESDNTAALILFFRVPEEDYKYIYENLDIEYIEDNNQVIITTKGYASILKALYFSSILHKEDSQYILELLTFSDYIDRIRAPIPKEITVANKSGIFSKDLHQDCGIVYLPRRPYLLCMASLSSEEEAARRIQEVSRMVYQYISHEEI